MRAELERVRHQLRSCQAELEERPVGGPPEPQDETGGFKKYVELRRIASESRPVGSDGVPPAEGVGGKLPPLPAAQQPSAHANSVAAMQAALQVRRRPRQGVRWFRDRCVARAHRHRSSVTSRKVADVIFSIGRPLGSWRFTGALVRLCGWPARRQTACPRRSARHHRQARERGAEPHVAHRLC